MLDGTKKDLATRIQKWEERRGDPGRQFREISNLRLPKLTSLERPRINQHYADTFNSVDKFNRLQGEVSYVPRCSDSHSRLITGIITVAIVNACVLVSDWREGTERQENETLRSKAKELYLALKNDPDFALED